MIGCYVLIPFLIKFEKKSICRDHFAAFVKNELVVGRRAALDMPSTRHRTDPLQLNNEHASELISVSSVRELHTKIVRDTHYLKI